MTLRIFTIRIIPLLLLICIGYRESNGTVYYSRASGNWNSNATWSTTSHTGGAAASWPGELASGDIVYISGHDVAVNVTPGYALSAIYMTQDNASADTRLNINTAGITLTCSSFSMYDNGENRHMDLEISSTAIFQVNGDASISRSTANTWSRRMQLWIWDSGRMNVTGNFTYTFGRAANGTGQGTEILLGDNGMLDIAGTLTMEIGYTRGNNNLLDLVMTGSSVLNAGNMVHTVTDSDDGDDLFMDLDGGTISVSGSWDAHVDVNCTGNTSITYYVDAASVTCGHFEFLQQGGKNGDMSLLMNRDSTTASSWTINGNMTLLHDDGDNMEVETNTGASIVITGKFLSEVHQPSNGDIYILDLNGGSMSVADSMVIDMVSNTNYFQIRIDGASLSAGGIHFIQTGNGIGDMYIYLNDASTANPASLTVGSHGIVFDDNGGDNMDIDLNGNSTLVVNGDITINNNLANGNDRNRIRMQSGTPAPVFTVNGNITGTLANGTGTGDEIILDINAGTFTCTGDITLTSEASCTGNTECVIDIDGDGTVFSAGGTITMNHLGGNGSSDDIIDIGTNAGSPVFSAGAIVLNGQGGDETRLKMNNSTVGTVNGDITLVAAADDMTWIDLNNSAHLKIKGSFNRSPSPNRFGELSSTAGTTVEYCGTGNTQVIAGDQGDGSDGFSYADVIINNSYGSTPQLMMNATEGNATIPGGGSLTFISGIVSSLPDAMFVVSHNATSTDGNDTSYVDGPIKKVGTLPTSFVFPTGDGVVWARLGIAAFNGFSTTTEFTCEYFFLPSPFNSPGYMGNTVGPQLDHVSFIEHWELDRVYDVGDNANCEVTLYWEDSVRSVISNLPDLRVAHYETNGTAMWENHGQSSVTTSGTAGTITSSVNVANFSPISFGSWSGANPLPVELLYFTAYAEKDGSVSLAWETASEQNNDYFTVERSHNGVEFNDLLRVNGAGTTTSANRYEAIDPAPFSPVTWYRLRQTDYDGTETTSGIRRVRLTGKNLGGGLEVYPNPATRSLVLDWPSGSPATRTLSLVDITGKQVKKIVMTEPVHRLDISDLPTGMYFLHSAEEGPVVRKVQVIR